MNTLTIHQVTTALHQTPDGTAFMLAADLAKFYEVEPKRIAEAVRRNPKKFPERFCRYLSLEEMAHIGSQNATRWGKQSKDWRPLAIFERGALMFANVLKSDVADAVSVMIIDAFVALRDEKVRFVKNTYAKHVENIIAKSPRLTKTRRFVEMDWTFEQIWRALGKSQFVAVEAIHELQAFNVIDRLPEGMPPIQLSFFGSEG